MMLGRLRLTQRLSLLLVLPLAAVVLISVPFTVERVDDARAAVAIVDVADNALAIGGVVGELQQERVLALAYLASPRLRRPVLVAQIQSTVDAGARAAGALHGTAAPPLASALAELDGLGSLRQSVLARQASVAAVYHAYHDTVEMLINALHLGQQPGADAVGVRQMNSLDALLRTNEEADQVGAALAVAAVDPASAAAFATVAASLRQAHLDNFLQQGDPPHVALLRQGAEGPSATRTTALVAVLVGGSGASAHIAIDDSLSIAQTGLAIRRVVQERIGRDIATRARGRAASAAATAATVAAGAATLVVLVVWLGVALSRSVARPLRRVTLAATAVADLASRELIRATDVDSDDEGPPRLAALTIRTADEVGELASAFNRVQATAALLMQQQVTTRHNVAVMFGNIAHRTQSLVARQLAHIDELERDERDEQRLENLYRLDHLTARLRRSADSLLVIAGARDDGRLASPTRLADVIRSAAAEIEGYRNVRLDAIGDTVIKAATVPDLTLLLAELLENATAFSPPNVAVEVSASLQEGCLIRIIDRGIGIPPERLAEENRRLVSRERLDIAPTKMLGLFVVGRLARRHGIDVRLVPTPVTGITAEIAIPADAQLTSTRPPTQSPPVAVQGTAARRVAMPPHTAPAAQRHDFGWFDHYQPTPAPPVYPANGSAHAHGEPNRGGLRQRQPGQSMPDGLLPPARATTQASPASRASAEKPFIRDPQVERDRFDAFTQGTARAGADRPIDPSPQPPQPGPIRARESLQRRRPGEHLPQDLRDEKGGSSRHATRGHPVPAQRRDAEAQRAQLNGYLDGLARAADSTTPFRDPRSRP